MRALAWPLNLMSHPPELVSAPRSAPSRPTRLLAPLMGSALTGELGGLALQWRGVRYPMPPLSALCVLSPELIAVATSSDVRILSGRIKGAFELIELTRLSLPRPTYALLCETRRGGLKRAQAHPRATSPSRALQAELIMIGGYGLLTAQITAQTTAQTNAQTGDID